MRDMNEPLCFCEYVNVKGERSHMIATCCDCEAVDSACDRCCKCQSISDESYEGILLLIRDRIRLPWCSGRGAKQLEWQIVGPLLCILLMLSVGSLHPVLTVLSIGILGFCIFKHHRVWSRKKVKPRTTVFYNLGLSSAWIMLLTFLVIIMPLGKVYFWQLALFGALFSAMMWTLVHARKDPGYMRLSGESQITNSSHLSQNSRTNTPSAKDCYDAESNFSSTSDLEQTVKVADASTKQLNLQRTESKHSIPLNEVNWVDSRPIKDGAMSLWCDKCDRPIPARGAHCPVCRVCVHARDHHCVWIDQCIGGRNHRSFVLLMVLWVLSGLYGSHLALVSLCSFSDSSSSSFVFRFLVPMECPLVYHHFGTAVAFVGTCYTVLCCLLISAVLLNQVILIAQDLTSQELHNALKMRWVQFLCCAKNNKNNRGFVKNCISFFSNERAKCQGYNTTTV